MSPVRRSILVLWLLAACAPAQKVVRPVAPPPSVAAVARVAAPPPPPAPPRCGYVVRRLSAPGRGALHPWIAAAGDAFAIAWEETTGHRSIRVQTFGPDAQPLGSSIEVADLSRGAAEPRVAATPDGDGFVVLWSSQRPDGAPMLAMRLVDRTGKPKSDVVPVIVAPGARALDVAPRDDGWALAWGNGSGAPHQLAVSFLDHQGRAVGKPLPLTRAPAPDPAVELASGGRSPAVVAWAETVGDAPHVIVGKLDKDRLEGRLDLGPGGKPRIGAGVLVWERPSEGIWSAPLEGGTPLRITDGHAPAAAPRRPFITALCYLDGAASAAPEHRDELTCGNLVVQSQLLDETRIAAAPRGIDRLRVAVAGSAIGVAWQAQEEDDTGVSFASLTCPDVAVATPRR